MWFLLHCANKNEEKMIEACKAITNEEILQDAFCITYDCMRRYQGAWHVEQKNLFPKYVILESGSPKQLVQVLESSRDMADLLKEECPVIPIKEEREQLLRELCGSERHLPMSKGVIRSGQTYITEGPLRGREQMIARIDRHKRLAFLKFSDAAMDSYLRAGLEITEKTV